MPPRITLYSAFLLTIPPALWAANTVVGRALVGQMPPMTINLVRWLIALVLLLPLGMRVLRPQSLLWKHWKRYALLGLLGIGCYNAFQYLALETSQPVNVALVASSIPVWMLSTGRLFYGKRVTFAQAIGALLSICGVLVVMTRGDWHALLHLKLVPGDAYVIFAAICWAFYSWELAKPIDPPEIRGHWASFLVAQVVPGIFWSALLAGAEWGLRDDIAIHWSLPVIGALLFVSIGPAIIAFRCWGRGVELAGPAAASFFINLMPLFAALLSALFLNEMPQLYHAISFVLIVAGIVVSSRRR